MVRTLKISESSNIGVNVRRFNICLKEKTPEFRTLSVKNVHVKSKIYKYYDATHQIDESLQRCINNDGPLDLFDVLDFLGDYSYGVRIIVYGGIFDYTNTGAYYN